MPLLILAWVGAQLCSQHASSRLALRSRNHVALRSEVDVEAYADHWAIHAKIRAKEAKGRKRAAPSGPSGPKQRRGMPGPVIMGGKNTSIKGPFLV